MGCGHHEPARYGIRRPLFWLKWGHAGVTVGVDLEDASLGLVVRNYDDAHQSCSVLSPRNPSIENPVYSPDLNFASTAGAG